MTRYALFLISFLTLSCSSLFYHPTRNIYYVEPSKIKIPPEIIKFNTSDGEELEGWYFRSQSARPKGFILHFHGNAQNVSTHYGYLFSAAQLGYDYLVFDYRGFGNSTGKPNPEGLLRDSEAAYLWAKEKSSERGGPDLIYFCQSLGSAVCLRAMSEGLIPSPEVLVIDSGFSSYRSVARSVAQGSWLLWPFQTLAWLMVDNSKAPKGHLSGINAKSTLVVHGDQDRVVPYKQGESVYREITGPKEFWSIPGGRHCDFLFREEGKYHARFFAWLQEALKDKD